MGTTKKVAVSSRRCALRVVQDRLVLTEGGLIDDREVAGSDMKHDWPAQFDLASINVSSLVAIEVFRRESEVPMDYRSGNVECGLVQLWTNRP